MNLKKKVSQTSRENARLNRESELNPPDFEPGMDEGSDDMGDFDFDGGFGSEGFGSSDFGDSSGFDNSFGSSSGFDNSFGSSSGFDSGFGSGGFGGSGFDSGFGSGGFGGSGFDSGFGNSGFGNSGFGAQQPAQQEKAVEDQIFEGLAKGAKGSVSLVKACVTAKKTFDVYKRMAMGKQEMLIGGIAAIVGVLLWIVLAGIGKAFIGISLVFGGLISVATGVMLFMFAYDKRDTAPVVPTIPQAPSTPEIDMTGFGTSDNDAFSFDKDNAESDFAFDDAGGFDFDDTSDDSFGDASEGADDGADFDTFDFSDDSVIVEEPSAPVLTKEEILDTLNVDNGMVTRQYLFEHVIQILESKTPDYDKVTELDENSDDFNDWAAIVEECATALKTNDNNKLPQLIGVKEKLFYYTLTLKRERWCKTDNLVNEIVNYVGYDEDTGKMEEGVYGHGHEAAGKAYITVMKGDTAMITVRDVMEKCKDFFLDTKNYIPVTLGVDADGEPVLVDLKGINSMLITGMPRSGKSWAVKSILAQMMFFRKPSELQFYLMDPKGDISDFRTVKTPHIKKFVSTDEGIVRELRYIVREFAPKRKKLFGEANCVNIWDYKEANPDVEMPLIYVLIDEVVTLAERMDKETKTEFQALLTELVSQLPALGIRIFMIPHVVKDQIIKKTTTDLIPCRISVRGDAAHIEATLGDKNFPYKLSHVGDMAVRLNNDPTKMTHSSILASTNPGTDSVFDFLGSMWKKIEPDMVETSVMGSGVKSDSAVYDKVEEEIDLFEAKEGNSVLDLDAFDDTAAVKESSPVKLLKKQSKAPNKGRKAEGKRVGAPVEIVEEEEFDGITTHKVSSFDDDDIDIW